MPSRNNMSRILSALIYIAQPVSTKQVAGLVGISWKTARDNLEALFHLSMVERKRVGKNKRIYWRTDERIIRTLSLKEIEDKEKSMNIKEDADEFLKKIDKIGVKGHIYKRKYSPRKRK